MPKLPRLRWYRERQALSQEELAQAAGVSRVTITRLEGGEDAFPQTARKIAAALGVSPAELMESDSAKRAA
jgi:transcriptional regulator with XRE-family HTH domain